jgi:8-oxo-dGTP pyrophosphatase MutT (NUDIX family)
MTRLAPWTVVSSRTTFTDPWLTVRSDQVRTAEGDAFGPFHIIEYPDWVTVVGLTESFSVVLVREYRHGIRAVSLGLPGGLVDRADGPPGARAAETAARRELLEETGHGGGTLEPLVTVHPNPSNQTNTAYCFLATGLSRITQPQQGPGEVQDTVEADLTAVLEQLREGVLTLHAVHVAALWSAAARIAGEGSDRFGPLTVRLRRFLSGQGPRCPAAARHVLALAAATVGG